jgi:hypothetical protein
MNTLEQRIDKLEALMAAVEKVICPPNCCLSVPEQPTTPKPRCDAQGRLLEAPEKLTDLYYISDGGNVIASFYGESGPDVDGAMVEMGRYFISQPAAEAELTRLQCLQRLRGMEGFDPNGGYELAVEGHIIMDGFNTTENRNAAEATITPEERAAFLYREPMGEK